MSQTFKDKVLGLDSPIYIQTVLLFFFEKIGKMENRSVTPRSCPNQNYFLLQYQLMKHYKCVEESKNVPIAPYMSPLKETKFWFLGF